MTCVPGWKLPANWRVMRYNEVSADFFVKDISIKIGNAGPLCGVVEILHKPEISEDHAPQYIRRDELAKISYDPANFWWCWVRKTTTNLWKRENTAGDVQEAVAKAEVSLQNAIQGFAFNAVNR